MTEDVERILREHMEDYPTFVRKVIPQYDKLQKKVVGCLPFKEDDTFTVLDLGIGFGETSEIILKRYPKARIVGIDILPDVIEKSKEKLAPYSGRVNFTVSNMSNFNFPESYDAVISVLSIHHLTHKQKKVLFRRIYQSLNPNGILSIGDLVTFEDSKKNSETKKSWEKYLCEQFNKKYADFLLEVHKREETPSSLENQINFMKKVGFKNSRVVWEYMNFAVFSGKKSN